MSINKHTGRSIRDSKAWDIIDSKYRKSGKVATVARRERNTGEPVKTIIKLLREEFEERFIIQTVSKEDDYEEVVRVTDKKSGFRFEFSRRMPNYDGGSRTLFGSNGRVSIYPQEGYFLAGRGAEWMNYHEITAVCIEIANQKNKIYQRNAKRKIDAAKMSEAMGRKKVAEIYGVTL